MIRPTKEHPTEKECRDYIHSLYTHLDKDEEFRKEPFMPHAKLALEWAEYRRIGTHLTPPKTSVDRKELLLVVRFINRVYKKYGLSQLPENEAYYKEL